MGRAVQDKTLTWEDLRMVFKLEMATHLRIYLGKFE